MQVDHLAIEDVEALSEVFEKTIKPRNPEARMQIFSEKIPIENDNIVDYQRCFFRKNCKRGDRRK